MQNSNEIGVTGRKYKQLGLLGTLASELRI